MLSILDPRAALLAKKLAKKRKTTMTNVIIEALENELRKERDKEPLVDRLAKLAEKATSMAGPNQSEITKEEIDALWGQ